jgi:hypothetical protein
MAMDYNSQAFKDALASNPAFIAAIEAQQKASQPTLDYNDQSYSASYEPSKDTSLSYADRIRLQMAKDEAIRDSQMTMSLDEAMALLGEGYLKDSGADLSGDQYKQAYDRITDAFENPNALEDMTDEQITQLQRLGSSSLSGNLYDIARARDDIADASYFDTDLTGLLQGAGGEAVRRYGTGMFSEEYAADPTNPDVPRVGAGDLADAIRGEQPVISQPAPGGGGGSFTPPPVPERPPGYQGPLGAPSTDFGRAPGSSMGAPGEYERTNPTAGMSNQQLYDTQFSNLLNQSNNFQEQQQIAAGIRNEANAAPDKTFDSSSAFDWYTNPTGEKGIPTREISAGGRDPETGGAIWDMREGITPGMTNQEIVNKLYGSGILSDAQKDVFKAHWSNPQGTEKGDSQYWAGGGFTNPDELLAAIGKGQIGETSTGYQSALDTIANNVFTRRDLATPPGGGASAIAGTAVPFSYAPAATGA